MKLRITKYQRQLIGQLSDGCFISVFQNHSSNEKSIELQDKEGNVFSNIRESTLQCLIKNGILLCEHVYSTVQPDTDNWHYKLKGQK